MSRLKIYRGAPKRLLDLTASAAGLVVLSPVIAVIAILVRSRLGSPVIFRQTRPGLHDQPFELMKFRTMTDETDANGSLLPDQDRLGPFGQFLRNTSLDELPELLNVLRGEMSIVGPRPLLMSYLPLYSSAQRRRSRCRPGITGFAQVNGRNNSPWPERFEMDNWYCDNVTLRLDLKILWATVGAVVSGSDVSQDGQATVEPFAGNPVSGD